MLWNYNRIERSITIPWHIQWNFTKIGLKGLFAESVAAVTTVFTGRIILGITQMLINLCFQKRFNTLFAELLNKLFKFFLRLDFI